MKRYCRNCYHLLPYKAKFCAHCGQKDTDGRIGMKSLMGRIWNNTFHLEGKFIRTAWQLFLPGKVTTEFFKGKQDRYPHPIRLFAIVMFLFLFLLNSMLKNTEASKDGGLFNYQTEVTTESGDSIVEERTFSVYERMKYQAMLYDMRSDYENLPSAWKTPHVQYTVDSLMQSFASRYSIDLEGELDSLLKGPMDSTGFGMGMGGVQIATLDLVRYEPEEIIQRYKITDWFEKLIVRQGIKAYKTPEAFIHALIGSLTWAILALVALMSGVLGLLYIRQNRYYVEHFIFLLHFHTGAMLLLLIALVGERLGLWGTAGVGFAAILPLPGMYLALLRYYGQGWFKTFMKWILYCFFYLLAFTLLFVGGMFVVFAFY
ncbi:MAG: DUF3667 domain-containing protein [Saprospiraceae bacterium]|nr:DUF3667 domain-containing protein [Saprospiraceae bacterium]